MKADLDSLPSLTARQAYLAMREFIANEFELAGNDKTIHIGGLLAEMEPVSDGTTSDPGAGITFVESVQKVLSAGYSSAWSRLQGGA
jgi:hypothetical protein